MSVMSGRLKNMWKNYPRQFWLLFFGMMISVIGSSMIWPFLMVYVSKTLDLPLTVVASLMTLNATMGLIASFVAGPITDRAGRKWVMAISLFISGMANMLLGQADTLWQFAVLMSFTGAFTPLYRVGADAMMADLVTPEKRLDAYSLLRTSNNVGVALGPVIGGWLATMSYAIAFYCAAAGLVIYGLMITFFARETLSSEIRARLPKREVFGGYGRVLRDKQFMHFNAAFTLTHMAAAMVWLLLAVYTIQQFGISESRYSYIPMTNALMVIFFQFLITQRFKRYRPLANLAFGALFYALAVGGVAWAGGYWGFLACMVVMTIGELIQSPTATTYAANLAPPEMRGRYMGIFGLTWNVASGTAPVLGGFLSDTVSPQATWYGGGLLGLLSMIYFLVLLRLYPHAPAQPSVDAPVLAETATETP